MLTKCKRFKKNLLRLCGCLMCRLLQGKELLHFAHTVCSSVPCVSQNKQLLFPHAALAYCFLQPRLCTYCAVRTEFLNIIRCIFCLLKVKIPVSISFYRHHTHFVLCIYIYIERYQADTDRSIILNSEGDTK